MDDRPFTITGRIDRIDHHPELGWAVFDYKAGDRGDGPDDTHRKKRGQQKEWVDLQLPLYRHLLADVRDGEVRSPVQGRPPGEVRLGYIVLPREVEHTREIIGDWGEDELQDADEAAREVVRLLRRGRFEYDASRVSERRAGALASLLGLGYLEAAADDDREESE